jgi:hypothetical protein
MQRNSGLPFVFSKEARALIDPTLLNTAAAYNTLDGELFKKADARLQADLRTHSASPSFPREVRASALCPPESQQQNTTGSFDAWGFVGRTGQILEQLLVKGGGRDNAGNSGELRRGAQQRGGDEAGVTERPQPRSQHKVTGSRPVEASFGSQKVNPRTALRTPRFRRGKSDGEPAQGPQQPGLVCVWRACETRGPAGARFWAQ